MARTGRGMVLIAGMALAAVADAAEPLPYGHKDFVPTPERPIYFRAGNGEYPGATPPLEWWEGTPGKIKVGGIFGNPPARRTNEVWDCTDTKSRNILWKAPVPGWTLSHPIVVKRRVFAVGDPDFVTCWDLDTGKQLWQRRMMPLLLDLPAGTASGTQSQTLQGGGLDEKRAAAGQKVLDLARALMYVGTRWPVVGAQPDNLFNAGWKRDGTPDTQDPDGFVTKKKAMAGQLVKMVEKFRPDVEAFGDAQLLAAVDKDLAILKRYQAVKDLAELKALRDEKAPGRHDPLRPTNLIEACLQKLNVDMGGSWWGYVGSADSTLASDGQRIYGVMDQGQVFCLDFDGKLLWGHREKGRHDNRGTFHRSPILCGDPAGGGAGLLLVRSLLEVKGTGKSVRALDTRTGQVRWEAPLAGSNYTIPRLMRLPSSASSFVDVLIGDAPGDKANGMQVLRVADGKTLGHFPRHDCGRGALMAIFGDVVTWTSASDTGGGPSCSYRLKWTAPDAVGIEKNFVLGEQEKKERIFYNQHEFPTTKGTAWLYGDKLIDAVTGKDIVNLKTEKLGCAVVAGKYLIALVDEAGPYGRKRDDRRAVCRFVVVDLSVPAQPKIVADRNLLAYADPPADIIVKNYFGDFDPFSFAGCYAGTPSFTALMSGPLPHGDRLLIQTTAYLYCIGPAGGATSGR